jgi:prepilin-type N-terminal cleavage/methylation domain-containing protein
MSEDTPLNKINSPSKDRRKGGMAQTGCQDSGEREEKPSVNRNRGLTIIELVVVMCILGIMVLIAIPNIGRWLPRYRLRSAARDVASNMQLARLGAIKDNREWALIFDVNAQSYRVISNRGPDGNWGTADDTVEKAVNLSDYPTVRFGDSGHGPIPGGAAVGDGVTFAGETVEFFPAGTSISGSVYLQNKLNGAAAIRTEGTTGIIRVWGWDSAWGRM